MRVCACKQKREWCGEIMVRFRCSKFLFTLIQVVWWWNSSDQWITSTGTVWWHYTATGKSRNYQKKKKLCFSSITQEWHETGELLKAGSGSFSIIIAAKYKTTLSTTSTLNNTEDKFHVISLAPTSINLPTAEIRQRYFFLHYYFNLLCTFYFFKSSPLQTECRATWKQQ